MSGEVMTRETSQEIQYQSWGVWDVTLVMASVAAVALAIFVDMPVFFGMALSTSMYTVCADRSYTVVNNTTNTTTTTVLPAPPQRSDDDVRNQLQQAIANNQAAGEAHGKEVEQLKKEPARLQAEIDRLTEQIAAQQQEIEDYENVNGRLLDEIIDVERELEQIEALNGTLGLSMGNLMGENEALKKEMHEMKNRASGPLATPKLNKHLGAGSPSAKLVELHQKVELAYAIIQGFLLSAPDQTESRMAEISDYLFSKNVIPGSPSRGVDLVTKALEVRLSTKKAPPGSPLVRLSKYSVSDDDTRRAIDFTEEVEDVE